MGASWHLMPYATVASQYLRAKAVVAGAVWSACRYLSRGRGRASFDPKPPLRPAVSHIPWRLAAFYDADHQAISWPVLCPTSSVPSQDPKELTQPPQSLPSLFCHSTMSKAHEAQQEFPSGAGDERARTDMASICPGSQAKSKKVPTAGQQQLERAESVPQYPQETNGKDIGCWCG